MLSDDTSAKKSVTRNGAPPPAPKGNQRAKGRKDARGDFLTQKLVSQLHEVVKRDVPRVEYYTHGGKIKKRVIVSQQTHEKVHFLIEALIENGMNGETDAIKYIFDRIEGRPVSIVPDGDGNNVFTVHFLPVDQRI